MTGDEGEPAFLLGGPSACLDLVRDPASGAWRDVASTADQLASDALFNRLREGVRPTAEGPRRIVAVIDSGILEAHPRIRGMIVDHHDFTGRGRGDEHGHGTLVALILLRGNDTTNLWDGLLDVRVCGPSPVTTEASLEQAIDWVTAWALARPDCRVSMNLSIGVRRAGPFRSGCRGKCRVCRAAIRAADAGVFVTAAAGNDRVTTCPAAAAFVHPAIVAATGLFETAARGTHGAEGTVYTGPLRAADGAVGLADPDAALAAAGQFLAEQRSDDAKVVLLAVAEHAELHNDPALLATAQQDLGLVARLDGDLREAERIWREVLASGQPVTGLTGLSLGVLLEETGRRSEAIAVLRTAAATDHPHTAGVQYQLGVCLAREGLYEEARVWLSRALDSDDQEATTLAAVVLADLPPG